MTWRTELCFKSHLLRDMAVVTCVRRRSQQAGFWTSAFAHPLTARQPALQQARAVEEGFHKRAAASVQR